MQKKSNFLIITYLTFLRAAIYINILIVNQNPKDYDGNFWSTWLDFPMLILPMDGLLCAKYLV